MMTVFRWEFVLSGFTGDNCHQSAMAAAGLLQMVLSLQLSSAAPSAAAAAAMATVTTPAAASTMLVAQQCPMMPQ